MKVKLFLSMLALAFGLCNCDLIEKTDEATTTADAIEAMGDYSHAAWHFQAVGVASEGAILSVENMPGGALKSNSPKITIEQESWESFPKTITVDFGTSGIRGHDGITRKGKLHIELQNAWYGALGSVQITTLDNYEQNNHKIEGVHTVINTGKNNSGKLTYSVKIEDGKISNTAGQIILYAQETIRTWIKGDDTALNILDDVYNISGNQEGTCSNGVIYRMDTRVNHPLVIELSCGHIKSGILDITIANTPAMYIDYFTDKNGDNVADCTAEANLHIGNNTYKIGNIQN